jgi:hypothetical protein
MYATDELPRTDSYRSQANQTLEFFAKLGIAVFPGTPNKKGSYVEGWPEMPADLAIALTLGDFAARPVNLAGRDGVAVLDLDAKSGVDPAEMLALLRGRLESAIIAIVRTGRGYHVWARIVASVGNGFCSFIGGDIFAEPHLAMLPPSRHPDGGQYAWELEPREPQGAVDLRALGLVPDKPGPSTSPRERPSTLTPAAPHQQDAFAQLMAEARVARFGAAAQELTLCPWHADHEPSLSINWRAAVFYCFSEHCGVRGGLGSLRRLVRPNTPSYRQSSAGHDVQDRDAE